jgi:hypothetical protein
MTNSWLTRFRAWFNEPVKREAAEARVVVAARALIARYARFGEMGTEQRILVEALEHLDNINSEKK